MKLSTIKKSFGFFLVAIVSLPVLSVLASTTTGTISSGVGSGNFEAEVPYRPTSSVAAGTYTATQSVILSSSGATSLRYTIDGTTPTCSTGTVYSSAVSVTSSLTLKAIACKNSASSDVASFAYVLQCATASVTNGTVAAYPTCTISCNTGYTLSGSSCNASGSTGGGGGGASDTTAPAITNVVATPTTGNTATITWQTNESSLSWILYGTTTVYGQQTKTTSYTSSHSVILIGLTPNTTYHYQVKSQDSSSNVAVVADKTFTTLAAGATASVPTTTTPAAPVLQKPISQMTRTELITFIIQLIASMNAGKVNQGNALGQQPSTSAGLSAIPETFTFQTNLRQGVEMIDAKYLQIVLNSDPDTQVSSSGAGSPGRETTKFGGATLAAVKKFQVKYGIAPAAGFVGPATREKLNQILGH